jgi:hypothetical protein
MLTQESIRERRLLHGTVETGCSCFGNLTLGLCRFWQQSVALSASMMVLFLWPSGVWPAGGWELQQTQGVAAVAMRSNCRKMESKGKLGQKLEIDKIVDNWLVFTSIGYALCIYTQQDIALVQGSIKIFLKQMRFQSLVRLDPHRKYWNI